jgi:hypothetical protein
MRRWKALVLALLFGLSTVVFAPSVEAGKGGGRPRSHSTRSYSPRSSSRGYYRGPRQPAGTYMNGVGSSHKGGHYTNPYTGNRYQKRK